MAALANEADAEINEKDLETGDDPGFKTMGIDGKGASTSTKGDGDDEEENLYDADEQLLSGESETYIGRAKEDSFLFCLDLRTGIIWISICLPLFLIADMLFFTPWKDDAWFWWPEYGWILGSFICTYHGLKGMAHFKMKNTTILQVFLMIMVLEAVFELLIWLEFYTREKWFKYDPIFFVIYFGFLCYSTYICILFISKVNAIRIQKGRPMFGAFKVTWPGAKPASKELSGKLIDQFDAETEKLINANAFYICKCGEPRLGFLILGGIIIAVSFVALIASLFFSIAAFFAAAVSLITMIYGFNGMYYYRLSHVSIMYLLFVFHLIHIFDACVRNLLYAILGGLAWPMLLVAWWLVYGLFCTMLFLDAHKLVQMANTVHARNGIDLYAPYGIKVPRKFVRK